MSKDSATSSKTISTMCKLHKDKYVECFCTSHDELCCKMCSLLLHRSCVGVESIYEQSENILTSKTLQNFTEKLECMLTQTHGILAQTSTKFLKSKWSATQATKKTTPLRQEVMLVFDELETCLRAKIKCIADENKDSMHCLERNLQTFAETIETMLTEISDLVDSKRECQLYVLLKTRRREIMSIEANVKESVEMNTIKEFEVELNHDIKDTIRAAGLGDIVMPKNDPGGNDSGKADDHTDKTVADTASAEGISIYQADENATEEGNTDRLKCTDNKDHHSNLDSQDETTQTRPARQDETAQDRSPSQEETTQSNSANQGETTHDSSPSQGETTQDSSPSQGETTQDSSPGQGETTQDSSPSQGETTQESSPSQGETTQDSSPSQGETTQDSSPSQGETTQDSSPSQGETTQDSSPNQGETTQDSSPSQGETIQDSSPCQGETTQDSSPSQGEATQDMSASQGKTIRHSREFLLRHQYDQEAVQKPSGLPSIQDLSISNPLKATSDPDIRLGFELQPADINKETLKDSNIDETEEVDTRARRILQTLATQTWQNVAFQMKVLPMNSEPELRKVIEVIFEKAIKDPSNNSLAIAKICKQLSKFQVLSESKPHELLGFQKLLLGRCQGEFMKTSPDEDQLLQEKLDAIDRAPPGTNIEDLISQSSRDHVHHFHEKIADRRRRLGVARFIGELFKAKFLVESIIHDGIYRMMRRNDPVSLECACVLINTTGEELDAGISRSRVNGVLERMLSIANSKDTTAELRAELLNTIVLRRVQMDDQPTIEYGWSHTTPRSTPLRSVDRSIDPTKIRFSKQNVDESNIQLGPGGGASRFSGWGRARETPREDFRLRSPQTSVRGGFGRGSGGFGIPWNAPIQAVPLASATQESSTKDAEKRTNDISDQFQRAVEEAAQKDPDFLKKVDITVPPPPIPPSFALAPPATERRLETSVPGGFGRRLGGVGAPSAGEQSTPANRFSVLNKPGEDSSRRYSGSTPANRFSVLNKPGEDSSRRYSGSSPVRGDSKGRGGFGRPPSLNARHSRESEREKALSGAKVIGGRSSQEVPRERSRWRDPGPESQPAAPAIKELSAEDMEKKTNSILDEFLHIQDLKEAMLCVRELSVNNHHHFVYNAIAHVIERSQVARRQTGYLLHDLVKDNVISSQAYIKGLLEVLEIAEDMEIDIPKIWQYYGELISPMIQDGSVQLSFLKPVCQPLLTSNKAGLLLAHVLRDASHREGHKKVARLWASSGLQWTDFVPRNQVDKFLKNMDLEFTKGCDSAPTTPTTGLPVKDVADRLHLLIVVQGVDNENVFDWIDTNVDEPTTKQPKFIRALMTAVCNSAIKGEKGKERVEPREINKRNDLLQKYLDHQPGSELQALYALQALVTKLEHPPGVLRHMFDTLFDEDIISEDVFIQWEKSEDEPDGKGAALRQVVQFFTWLREAEDDC